MDPGYNICKSSNDTVRTSDKTRKKEVRFAGKRSKRTARTRSCDTLQFSQITTGKFGSHSLVRMLFRERRDDI